MTLIMLKFKGPFLLMGGQLFMAQTVFMVAFARVYFHCHYLGDCLAGAFLGTLLAFVYTKYGLIDLCKCSAMMYPGLFIALDSDFD